MPDLISKIPIGFNLEGYNFINSTQANTAPTAFVGIDTNWEGALIDDQWVADTNLKQVQVQTTIYQSAPLQYISEGKKYYGEVYDKQDKHSDIGGGAFAGGAGAIGARLFAPDINNCTDGKLSPKLQTWAENIDQSEKGRKDFYVGAAIATATLSDYLNHFYNLGVTPTQAYKLGSQKIVCAETLFNTNGSMGKAFRIKIVDVASGDKSRAGTKGTTNGGMYYQYDVFDIMTSLLLLNDFSEICYFSSKELNTVVNQGDLSFPWASAGYNYKKGQIPGYGPQGIANLGLIFESKAGTQIPGGHAMFKTKGLTNDRSHHVARVRFFVDPENRDKAKSIIPNLPEDFFQTNYADKGTAYFNTATLSNYLSVGALIEDYAFKIMRYGQYLKNQGKPMSWGTCGLRKEANQGATVGSGKNSYYIPAYRSTGGKCNCDAFVNWVLLESGVTNSTSIHNKYNAKDWTAAAINGQLNAGYSAIKVPDITQATPGDILVYDYKDGNDGGHCAIFKSLSGASITGYGMGSDDKAGGNTSIPTGEPSTRTLKEIIRIVKA